MQPKKNVSQQRWQFHGGGGKGGQTTIQRQFDKLVYQNLSRRSQTKKNTLFQLSLLSLARIVFAQGLNHNLVVGRNISID